MGTHNKLLRLGTSFYLEVIAIDPTAPASGICRDRRCLSQRRVGQG
nr:VOC family protein [Pseudomonas cedrina]